MSRGGVSRLLATATGLALLGVLAGCSGAPRSATEREKQINTGANPNTVQGKAAQMMMDSKLVPAPSGVQTGFAGGRK